MNLTRPILASAIATMAVVAMPAHALTLVATISGQYAGDTPNIYINNTSGFSFTSVQLQAQAYNGSNSLLPAGTDVDKVNNSTPFHLTQIKNLPTIGAGSSFTYTFSDGGQVCGPASNTGNLFAGDYDDTYGCSAAAHPGNSLFTFTAQWNGQSIFAQFSPDNNATGGYLGFLGLDQTGGAETIFDAGGAVSGTGQFGVLANIFIGVPPAVPEPTTYALFGVGLGALSLMRRRQSTR